MKYENILFLYCLSWECVRRKSLTCKGTLKTDLAVTQILREKAHCHSGNQSLIDTCKARHAMLTRSSANCIENKSKSCSSALQQVPQSA